MRPMPDLIPVLTAEDVIKAMRDLRMHQRVNYWAFYSSQLGGIVTDPALMLIAFDDHMVHRGHGVFDTAGLVDGKIYDLEAHLDRFIASAGRAKLPLPCSRDEMKKIIVETTVVAGHSDGAIRYWLSSGPGSLELSPAKGASQKASGGQGAPPSIRIHSSSTRSFNSSAKIAPACCQIGKKRRRWRKRSVR